MMVRKDILSAMMERDDCVRAGDVVRGVSLRLW